MPLIASREVTPIGVANSNGQVIEVAECGALGSLALYKIARIASQFF